MVAPLSIRELARHLPPPSNLDSLRALLFRPQGPVSVRSVPVDISVLTQNMGLLVSPAPYLGTDRGGAVAEIIARIRALKPDVVGLCEVFKDSEREHIQRSLADLYPQFREGPDKPGPLSDGGLLLMSRHPILAANALVYHMCDGVDCLANKGILHIRVKGPGWLRAMDIFYSHAQDISTSNGAGALHAQIQAMRDFMVVHRDFSIPSLLMGDLNIPADEPVHFGRMLQTLDFIRDSWLIRGNHPASGPTSIVDSNFYDDASDRPDRDKRLDYVLIRAGSGAVPIVASCEPVRFTRNGRLISDHLAVLARFDRMALFDPPGPARP